MVIDPDKIQEGQEGESKMEKSEEEKMAEEINKAGEEAVAEAGAVPTESDEIIQDPAATDEEREKATSLSEEAEQAKSDLAGEVEKDQTLLQRIRSGKPGKLARIGAVLMGVLQAKGAMAEAKKPTEPEEEGTIKTAETIDGEQQKFTGPGEEKITVNLDKEEVAIEQPTAEAEESTEKIEDESETKEGETGPEQLEPGVNYMSEKAQELIGDSKELLADLEDMDTPVVIGTMVDLVGTKEEASVAGGSFRVGIDAKGTGAFAFPATQFSERAREKLSLDENAVYLILNEEKLSEKMKDRVIYHESRHAKHYGERKKTNPEDDRGCMRYPELPQEANEMIEEIITNGETLDWLEAELQNSESKYTKEDLKRMIKNEKINFKDNYQGYYSGRYGESKNIPYKGGTPYGEYEVDDEIDKYTEDMFKKYNVIEVLGETDLET